MPLNKSKVLIGSPNQLTTAAVAYAAVGTQAPSDVTSALSGFTYAGYVSEDGISLSADYSTSDIKDWSKSTIRTILDEFTSEVAFKFMQTDVDTLKILFGEENVQVDGANVTVKMRAALPPRKTFVFDVKDGDNLIRIIVPDAQPVLDGELTFNTNEPVLFGVKLSCLRDDVSGDNIRILTNTGE